MPTPDDAQQEQVLQLSLFADYPDKVLRFRSKKLRALVIALLRGNEQAA